MIGELYPGEFEAMEHNGRMDALQQESCEDWCDVPSDEMTLEQARQAVKDLRKKLTEYLEQEPCDVFDKYGNYKYPSDVELTEPNTATSMPCEDAISRQAVLDAMSDTWKHICFVARRKKPTKGEEAVYSDMVGTVKNLPPATAEPCEDVISRQAVLNEIPVLWNSNGDKDYCMESLRDFVAELPPVNPQPCPDAINRQAVNEIINDIRDCISVEGYCAILERLKKLPSVNPLSKDYNTIYYTPQPKTGHWIPVSERLPEDFGLYLITLENGDVCQCEFNPDFIDEEHENGAFTYYHQYFDGATLGMIDEEEEAVDAIAWMPFEPYEPQESEEIDGISD